MPVQTSSTGEVGDINYGTKVENSIWPVVVVGIVALVAVIAGLALMKRRDK